MTDPQPAAPVAPSPAPAAPATISDEHWAGMSWADRLNYSRATPEEQARYRAAIPSTGGTKIGQNLDRSLEPSSPAGGLEPAKSDVGAPTQKLTADQYRIEHSKSFVAPEFSYRLDPSGPLATAARDFAAKHGLSQEQFSELVDLHVAGHAKEAEMYKQAAAAEIGKLGVNGVARVRSVQNWLNAMLGPDAGREMSVMLVNAGIITGFEKLVSKYSAKGVGPYAQRATPSDGRVDEQTFDSMSAADRLNYARRFDQSQFRQW
jgi:hypothetical protein